MAILHGKIVIYNPLMQSFCCFLSDIVSVQHISQLVQMYSVQKTTSLGTATYKTCIKLLHWNISHCLFWCRHVVEPVCCHEGHPLFVGDG